MRSSVAGQAVLSAPGSFRSSSGTGTWVTGTHRSPRNAERAGAPGAEPTALSQSQASVWRHVAGNS